jgi:hypothetical protein
MRRRLSLPVLLGVLLASGACGAAGHDARTMEPASLPSVPVTDSGSPATFTLSSPAIANGQLLREYRCEPKVNGVEPSIPLVWSRVPEGAGSLAVVMDHYPFPGDTTRVSS